MSNQTGIWIDLNKAVIVKINGKSATSQTIQSDIETKKREDGESGDTGRFGKQTLTDEKSKEHKLEQDIQKFLKKVQKSLNGTDELVLFGPAKMKHELQKSINKNASLQKKLTTIEVHPADSMTDNQTIAWVKDFFSQS